MLCGLRRVILHVLPQELPPHLAFRRFDEERKHWGGGLLGLKSQVCDDFDVDDDGGVSM